VSAAGEARLGEAYAHCERLTREGDRDRWLGALFAPASLRPRLHALSAFFLETGRVKARAREPLAGEARLVWWLEAIEGKREAEAAGHPVAAALIDAIGAGRLPIAAFAAYLEARREALYAEPAATREEIESLGRALIAPHYALAARALEETGAEEAALNAGMAAALAEAPGEEAAALARVDAAEAALVGRAAVAPAFAPLATLRLDLDRRARGKEGPAPAWRRQWAIWRWARAR
jgi:phytoene synthase